MKLPVLQPTHIGVWDWVLVLSNILDSNVAFHYDFQSVGYLTLQGTVRRIIISCEVTGM